VTGSMNDRMLTKRCAGDGGWLTNKLVLMYTSLSRLNYDQRCLFGYRFDVCVGTKAYHVYRAQSRIESFLVMP
jgi:hypothetical protein